MNRPALSGRLQRPVHLVLLIVGWSAYAAAWIRIGTDEAARVGGVALFWLLAGALLLSPAITLYWVIHNLGIFQRKGPRTAVRTLEHRYERDWLGREIRADWAQVSRAAVVAIEVGEGIKHYRSVEPARDCEAA